MAHGSGFLDSFDFVFSLDKEIKNTCQNCNTGLAAEGTLM